MIIDNSKIENLHFKMILFYRILNSVTIKDSKMPTTTSKQCSKSSHSIDAILGLRAAAAAAVVASQNLQPRSTQPFLHTGNEYSF